MKTKKYLIVLVLRILETCSDKANPMSQIEIADMISKQYPCDRKTVGRNIKFLREIGYPIIKTSRGFYMDKQLFSREEISLILDLVQNADAHGIDKNDLCQRLRSGLTKYYRR